MNSNVIEKAKKIIDSRRFDAESEAINNKLEAMKDDNFKELYLSYVNAMIESARKGEKNSGSLKSLKALYEKRLKHLKISSIEPIYSCPKCNDRGVTSDGYCDCLIDEVNKILKEESGFLNLEEFEKTNFEIFGDKENMKKLYSIMQKWCHSQFEKSLVFLAGQTGVGKTHLIKCMANELIKLHKVVLLTSSFAMHQDFVKSYACRDAETKQNIISKYIDTEVLFIDDLGTELRQPNITVNYLYQILNERKMKRKPTIITTNLKLDDIMDYYDERIYSRIADKASSICVYIEGSDLRLKNK